MLLVNPRGFCAGVERAIAIVERLLALHGAPIYVKHEIVHNVSVVEDFKQRGVIFIEDPDEVPASSVLVYSAHGVSQAVRKSAEARQLVVHDATCPLVTKVHAEVRRLHADGYDIVMIGHKGHPEVEGTLGQADGGVYLVENEADVAALRVKNPRRLAYVTQTTLSVDDTMHLVNLLKKRFSEIRMPRKDDICYATQNRQDAVKKIAADCDVILVVGSASSSNSNRLCEVARLCNVPAYLVDGIADINPKWLENAKTVGVSAGASAPENLVGELTAWLVEKSVPGATVQEFPGVSENVVFSVPKGLR
ncbi:MAG: 4-hydroxy-3-methylbut-2-enyl diphosphate reductase [Candidatus Zeuxoniibacter abyssi]|nr:MAG: 4-hydroxy-3-methylbut-2-enyl diphosphate reductase [Candidatus Persebacteraceae bacterium AB1(2)]